MSVHIDSHQHFWIYNATDYDWMSDEMQVLRRDHLPTDLASKLARIDFTGSVAVQARRMVAETKWLLDLADQNDFIRGVVGWFDFASDDLDRQLESLSDHPKLKGVREVIHDLPDVDYATSPVHVAAIAKLAGHGLTYDLLLKPPHIGPAIELVRQFSDQPFVVDHIAKPEIAEGKISPWREDIQTIAKYDNVFCKLSGMVTEARWGKWEADDFRPYLDIVCEAFGPQRLMIGSDWPVCTLSGSYEDVMAIVIEYVDALSNTERDAILGGTAVRFYRLDADQ